ncbi:MAG TPA: isoprenylcysteine carboxylmethyltransferase family protein [Chitinophagaceae bacterium]|nr:isoprenylcysteine carboxylmethyltransferase family protein [Chitinophagaceae bacterium]
MTSIVKQIISFILPITALIIVPSWIQPHWTPRSGVSLIVGVLLIIIGLFMMILTISSFIRIGQGTLAPWSPTKRLVIKGLYRQVRNPMILGVLTVLLGEALGLRSANILIWAGLFFVINTVYFIAYEEPNLEQRFGDDYRKYKKHVSRWLPRITPYRQVENRI